MPWPTTSMAVVSLLIFLKPKAHLCVHLHKQILPVLYPNSQCPWGLWNKAWFLKKALQLEPRCWDARRSASKVYSDFSMRDYTSAEALKRIQSRRVAFTLTVWYGTTPNAVCSSHAWQHSSKMLTLLGMWIIHVDAKFNKTIQNRKLESWLALRSMAPSYTDYNSR